MKLTVSLSEIKMNLAALHKVEVGSIDITDLPHPAPSQVGGQIVEGTTFKVLSTEAVANQISEIVLGLASNNMIRAIKAHRTLTGMGLYDSKQACEALRANVR